MNEKVNVRIQASCKVYFDQTVTMTRESLERLKATPELKIQSATLSPLCVLIDHESVSDWGDYDQPEMTIVDDEEEN